MSYNIYIYIYIYPSGLFPLQVVSVGTPGNAQQMLNAHSALEVDKLERPIWFEINSKLAQAIVDASAMNFVNAFKA